MATKRTKFERPIDAASREGVTFNPACRHSPRHAKGKCPDAPVKSK